VEIRLRRVLPTISRTVVRFEQRRPVAARPWFASSTIRVLGARFARVDDEVAEL
jgi:hypothetical protein